MAKATATKKLTATKPAAAPGGNMFAVIEKMNGNAASPAEFDEEENDPSELYFKADEDATEVEKMKCLILNYVHKDLHYDTLRKVPVFSLEDKQEFEVYHRATFKGVELDVCVHFADRGQSGKKECYAIVKLTSDTEYPLGKNANAAVGDADAMRNEDAQADEVTTKIEAMTNNYWCPRWKHVVYGLRYSMSNNYEKNGVDIKHPDAEPVADAANAADNGQELEEDMEIFAGCTGKLIGPQGSVIKEIKNKSGLKNMEMPPKDEGGVKPPARSPVQVKLIGTRTAINIAKVLITEIVDAWKNNRPLKRTDGGAGFGGGDGATALADPDPNPVAVDLTSAAWDDSAAAATGGAATGGNWADDANSAAAAVDSAAGGGCEAPAVTLW